MKLHWQGRGYRRDEKVHLQQSKCCWALLATLLLVMGGGCSRGDTPTRTPVPTFTQTPQGAAVVQDTQTAVPAVPTDTVVVAMPTATQTATNVPPTPTPTPAPTDTPTPQPTPTATLTPTVEPTATLTPEPSPTPTFSFALELAEKHPTGSLAPNVVRVFLFVTDEDGFALEGYSLRVQHNGAELSVERSSEGGLPGVTRNEPSPYTRFTNMNVIFVEAQAGTWIVQLVDSDGVAVGPAAEFELTSDEDTRELYVRYHRE